MNYLNQTRPYFKGCTYGLGKKVPGSNLRVIVRRLYLNGDCGSLERVGPKAAAYHLWVGPGQRGESLYCLGDGVYGYQVWKYDPQVADIWVSDQDSKNQQLSIYVRHLIPMLG